MASWQEFVDSHLMEEFPKGGTLSHAAIVGHDGSMWARSADFPDVSSFNAHFSMLPEGHRYKHVVSWFYIYITNMVCLQVILLSLEIQTVQEV